MTTKGTKMSREEFLQKRDIEEARKAGNAPAEIDAITGKSINPHIPQYISQAPWYLDTGVPTLSHQHQQKTANEANLNEWYLRGAKSAEIATKFRKGACENCGAMTHKTKDCLERPRKLGAKITGKDIQPDEVVQTVSLGFDGKRDRYNGYDADTYLAHIQEWEKIEEKRKLIRAKELEENLAANPDGEIEKAEVDEDKYAEDADLAGQKFDLKTRTTIRHLRIREDTAKYLRNLDVNSAYYDPKTRSMRDNPNKDRDAKDLDYAGDNFVRYTGEAKQMMEMQRFCWDANDKGAEISLQANPTMAELMNQGFKAKKEELKEKTKNSILEKYGGEEYLNAPPKELLFSQTERYVEYSRTGQIVKGQEHKLATSRYEEDVFPNNHTSVWGSYWEDGRWGFACCHQLIKNSYCTGQAGIEARKASEAHAGADKPAFAAKREEAAKEAAKEASEKPKEKSLQESIDERVWKKRKYNSMESHEFTDEDYQSYLKKKEIFDDPMKNYMDSED